MSAVERKRESVWARLWNLNWLSGTRTARRKPALARIATELDGLEHRCLPAIDLTLSAASVSVLNGPQGPQLNNFDIKLQYTVQNLGASQVDLTGTANDSSDNVKVAFFLSEDNVLDGNDNFMFTTNALTDGGPVVLQQNNTVTHFQTISVNATPNKKFVIAMIDYGNLVAESDGNNNTYALDVDKPFLTMEASDLNLEPKSTVKLDPNLIQQDLNNSDGNGGGIVMTISKAQQGDKVLLLKSGDGDDKLRIAGTKLKLGKTILGTVQKIDVEQNGLRTLGLHFEFTASVSRATMNRVLQNLAFKAGAKATGDRTAIVLTRDAHQNLSNLGTRKLVIA